MHCSSHSRSVFVPFVRRERRATVHHHLSLVSAREMTRSALAAGAPPLHQCVIRWLFIKPQRRGVSITLIVKRWRWLSFQRLQRNPQSRPLRVVSKNYHNLFSKSFPHLQICGIITIVKERKERWKLIFDTWYWQTHQSKLWLGLEHFVFSYVSCFL